MDTYWLTLEEITTGGMQLWYYRAKADKFDLQHTLFQPVTLI